MKKLLVLVLTLGLLAMSFGAMAEGKVTMEMAVWNSVETYEQINDALLAQFPEIAEQADILEKAGHASDTETISENTEKLLTDYRALKEELSAYITSTS